MIGVRMCAIPGALFENKRWKQNNGSTCLKDQGALKFIEAKILISPRHLLKQG